MRKILLLATLCILFTIPTNATGVGETFGIINSLDNFYLHVIGDPLTPAGKHDIIVDIADAHIYDLLTGFPAEITDITEGMSVRVAYIDQDAIAVWLNCNYDDSAVFTVVVSDNIQYGYEYTTFLSTDEKYRVTLCDKTIIIDPEYGEISHNDIVPGQEFFIWVDMITASSPSLVYPDKVVLIND